MWVFTPEGFYSLVQDKQDASKILVRSRIADDLERLLDAYINKNDAEILKNSITEWSGTDYRYRVALSRELVQYVFGEAAASITYTNFKNEVTEQRGHYRHDLYMKIWHIMNEAQHVESARNMFKKRI